MDDICVSRSGATGNENPDLKERHVTGRDQYQKLDKDTMEPLMVSTSDTSHKGMGDCPNHYEPPVTLLQPGGSHDMNVICQGMAAVVMQQIDSWAKAKYTPPDVANFIDTKTRVDHQNCGIFPNRYPVSIPRGSVHQIAMYPHSGYDEYWVTGVGGSGGDCSGRSPSELYVHRNYGHGALAFSNPPYYADISMSDMANRQHGGTHPQTDHSVQLRTGFDVEMQHHMDVENRRQQLILLDVDRGTYYALHNNSTPLTTDFSLGSRDYTREVSVDSFGLPLTTLEREPKQHMD